MEKLYINLFPEDLTNKYEIEKTKFDIEKTQARKDWEKNKQEIIDDEYERIPGGFLQNSYKVHRPDIGKIKADKIYGANFGDNNSYYAKSFPTFQEWSNNYQKLTSTGEQNVINKINEIIDYLNENENKNS